MEERRITLRMPSDLMEQIEDLAEKDVRSINGEIIVLLRDQLAQLNTQSQNKREKSTRGRLSVVHKRMSRSAQ